MNYDPIWKDETLCDARALGREVGAIGYGASRDLRHHAGATTEHAYCGQHLPSRMLARVQARQAREAAEQAARRAARAPYDEERDAREAVVAEAIRWRTDEAATGEGFCSDPCEHHECRLARAVERYEQAAARTARPGR